MGLIRRWRRARALRLAVEERDRRRARRWARHIMEAYIHAPTYGEARELMGIIMRTPGL